MSTSSCSACLDGPQGLPAAPSEDAARWPAVASLSLGVFGLVTAEFLPASLLTAMAADLHVSAGAAGQAVTATALVGAVAAPTIPVLTARFDRKRVLLVLTLLLLVSNVLAATAQSLGVLLAARVVLGIALGGFWSMAAALAMRLVPGPLFARAMSLVLTGVSIATVCAAPIGAWMGAQWGWRSAFVAAGVVGVVALAVQFATLPKLPPLDRASLRGLVDLLKRPAVRVALLAVLLAASLLVCGASQVVAAVAITLWGFAFGAFPVGFQTWIVRAAPDQAESAGGLLVAAFQVAIATGAIAGGVLVDRVGALGAPAFALLAVALGVLLTWRFGPRGEQA